MFIPLFFCLFGFFCQATQANLMIFGDCYIGEPKTQCLSITNRCQMDCIYFQWVDQYPLSFSPQIGHLRPGQAKEVTITFNADKPVNLQKQMVKCVIKKIIFDQPLNEVSALKLLSMAHQFEYILS